jgi:hypothetical protein
VYKKKGEEEEEEEERPAHFLYMYCFFTIYSRYLKRVISKRDGWEYLKQVPSSDGSLELV